MAENAQELAASFDLEKLTPEFYLNPYPTYRALREHEPIKRLPNGSWFLTRYDDLVTAYKNTRAFSSDKKKEFAPKYGSSPLYEHHTTSLVFNDPPIHTRVRRLIMGALSPRAIAAMEPDLIRLVDGLLDQVEAKGRFELIGDFASAIPVEIIGNLLDVPHEEREPLRGWSLAILGALEPVLAKEQFERGVAAVADFKAYLTDLVDRRIHERHGHEGEILSTLIAASDFTASPAAQERLSALELLHNCIFLLNAGHETTTNLIGNSIDLLIRNPDAMRDLRSNPECIETAIEEFLRMESSNQLGNRRATRDIHLGGVPIPAGSYVHIGIGAANRDPAQFPDPDRLDIRRQPNRHLAFATGIHACAGMSLARMEAKVAIGKMLARFSRIERDGIFVRGGRARFRGFLHYPVRVG